MIFNNISAKKKLETLNAVKIANEEVLYDSILRLGLDPDTFEPELFDRNSSNLPKNVDEILDDIERSITSLEIISREIAELEI
jgi:hypothetical protein